MPVPRSKIDADGTIMLSNKIAPDYLAYLQANPDAQIAAIVRCDALDAGYIVEAERKGLIVSRQLKLIRGLAVEGRAGDILALAEAPWVLSIEPDQSVHTMP